MTSESGGGRPRILRLRLCAESEGPPAPDVPGLELEVESVGGAGWGWAPQFASTLLGPPAKSKG